MTREEAIQTIQEMCKRYIFTLDEDEAVDMAIKSLQGDMYCPSCGVRLVSENEYVEPKPYKGGDME